MHMTPHARGGGGKTSADLFTQLHPQLAQDIVSQIFVAARNGSPPVVPVMRHLDDGRRTRKLQRLIDQLLVRLALDPQHVTHGVYTHVVPIGPERLRSSYSLGDDWLLSLRYTLLQVGPGWKLQRLVKSFAGFPLTAKRLGWIRQRVEVAQLAERPVHLTERGDLARVRSSQPTQRSRTAIRHAGLENCRQPTTAR